MQMIEKGDMHLDVRQARSEDLPTVIALYGQLGMDDGEVLTLKAARSIFDRMQAYPDYKLYVAQLDDDIVGVFALLIMDNLGHNGAPSGVIEDVVVHQKLRGRGIGKKMMDFAMERCRERGCYKISLSSNLMREKAHAFYESLGYTRHGYSFQIMV